MPRSRSIFIQSDRVRRACPRAATSPAARMAPPASSRFSVSVVLPASGCEIMAKVRRRAASVMCDMGQGLSLAQALTDLANGMKGLAVAGTCQVSGISKPIVRSALT